MPRGLARPVALFDERPERLAPILSIRFERTLDDLDELDGAVLLSDSGTYIGLVYHLHAPVKGIEILIDEHAKNARDALEQALRILAPAKPRMIWTHPLVAS